MVRYSPKSKWVMLTPDGKVVPVQVDTGYADGACGDSSTTLYPTNMNQRYIALLANLAEITPGPVDTAIILGHRPDDTYFDADSTIVIFRNDTTIVRRERLESGLRITAATRNSTALLFETDFEDEGRGHVIWAGDLDRDRQLDLLIYATYKYSVWSIQLHLSRKRGNQPTWPVAAHYSQAVC